MQKIFTLSRNARAISGNELVNSSQSKKVDLTSGQPGECVTTTATTAKKTTVLASATATPRRPSPAAPPAENPRAMRARVYFRTGAPVAFASHCCWISAAGRTS